MKRRTLFRSAAALIGLGALGAGANSASVRGNRYYQGPVSDHFDGTRFFNPDGAQPKGFSDLMRWRFGPKPAEWPESVVGEIAKPADRVKDLTVTMVGHATMLIQMQSLNILTDPVWSRRVSPLSFAGPRRVVAPGIPFEALPKIDLVLLSHNHYDHLDLETLTRLKAHDPLVITPLGNDTLLSGTGLRVQTMDWGDEASFGDLGVHCLPSHHWSARGMGDRSMALWSAFMLTGAAGPVHFIGDTGFDKGRPYAGLSDRFGAPRVALLPIGAYEPRWFMKDQHQNPEEAVQGFRISAARFAIGHHWGTIQLTNEARDAPLRALEASLHKHEISPDRFRALAPGEVWAIPA
ncbi:MBL fold metallo-hydrolase [Pacificoceanicola onchidii]|uniref:MBL fold metallo-hydrolase n=1 Tax=Pacificoceanicola onchidii TaxID=2562685 RepID=UPI0010A642B8|nr:MBL fold metallo-hydrolase [Pacificoceanicola onchidii]